ncbi:MAG TPA: hypothetical protein DCZ92_04395, partial [Elusimicrobia bacterium]|nr:hypothetical protein [Elusimicrobiota bacterium]
LSISELNPPPETEKKPEPEDNLAEASLEVPVPAEEKLTLLPTDDFSLEAPAPESSLGFPTAGFGPKSVDDSAIPDIDALMNLPEMTAEAGEERGQAPAGQPAETTAPEADPSVDELAEFEKQLAAAAPGGSMDLNSPKEENPELTPGQGEIPAQEQPSGLPASDETLRLEPAPEAAPQEEAVPEGLFAEIPAAAAEGTLRLEPEAVQAAINEPAAELSIEPQAVVEPAAELSIEPQAAVEPAPELSVGTSPEPVLSVPEAPASGGIELSVSPAAESTLQMRPADGPLSAAPSLSADMTQPGLSLEPRVSVATDSDDSEKTMLAAPPPSAEADGDKTMVFDVSSSSPGTTSRAKAGDLAGLSQSEPPPGLPEERIRSLYFLYAPEDAALCASLLMELDTVCLRSQTSPMFIKRTGVKVFEQDMNPNFVAQTVNDSGAKGLICVGAVPQDKVYEIENVFASSGVYFKHFDSTSFSHSAVLDLLLELILR